VPAGIDDERVAAWLAANVEGLRPPFSYRSIGGGRSNLTYLVVDADGRSVVLRRPPTGHVLATAHDMAREFRAMSAMEATPVPVPRMLGLCDDVAVNGAPFYVMELVEGDVIDSPAKAEPIPLDVRAAMSRHLVDVLADLHAVDVDAVGLGDLGRREGYVERQIARWSKQWAGSKTRDIDGIDHVAAELGARVPPQQAVAVVHGDYRFGNTITDPATGAVRAVLDWELCTLGDPLADLGYLGVHWAGPDGTGGRSNDPTGAGGFGSFADAVERYAARSGLDLSGIDYYVAFQSWRSAVILEGVYNRYLHGAMGESRLVGAELEAFRDGPPELVAAAAEALARGT
jgi:aminoglycoside phosphotransferase (APT) family kinase protein